ncbi:hypothetical protein [Robiginitalea biformata]|uniref:hypothetical protein n=1 Tax=Robiginitalea biformata TaxID=252307 RepID=UPI003B5BB77C
MVVLVFKTNVGKPQQVGALKPVLDQMVARGGCWSFDLEDCDKVFRVEHPRLHAQAICRRLQSRGFTCEELE